MLIFSEGYIRERGDIEFVYVMHLRVEKAMSKRLQWDKLTDKGFLERLMEAQRDGEFNNTDMPAVAKATVAKATVVK